MQFETPDKQKRPWPLPGLSGASRRARERAGRASPASGGAARSSAHRLFAYATAKTGSQSGKFVHASARVEIGPQRIQTRIGRRAYNPVLIQAGFADNAVLIPWLNSLPMQITFV